MFKRGAISGRVIGTPTTHHVTSMGNVAKQFIVIKNDGSDAVVLVTAGNSSLGYSIGNKEFREQLHIFEFDGRGKVISATPSMFQ